MLFRSSGADPFALSSINSDRNQSGSFTSADLDAELKVENTFTITRSTNTVTDVIAGVSLALVSAGSITLDVERDDSKIIGSVQQFIGVYNDVFKTTGDLRSQVLKGERGSLLNLEAQFRDILHAKAGNSVRFSRLPELGITTGADGKLTLDTSVFENALNQDPAGVADMFTNSDTGVAVRFQALAANLLGSGGLLDHREQSVKSRISATDKARSDLEFRLTQKEAALNKQFSALDALIAGLNTTSNYLSTQLSQIASIK